MHLKTLQRSIIILIIYSTVVEVERVEGTRARTEFGCIDSDQVWYCISAINKHVWCFFVYLLTCCTNGCVQSATEYTCMDRIHIPLKESAIAKRRLTATPLQETVSQRDGIVQASFQVVNSAQELTDALHSRITHIELQSHIYLDASILESHSGTESIRVRLPLSLCSSVHHPQSCSCCIPQ